MKLQFASEYSTLVYEMCNDKGSFIALQREHKIWGYFSSFTPYFLFCKHNAIEERQDFTKDVFPSGTGEILRLQTARGP